MLSFQTFISYMNNRNLVAFGHRSPYEEPMCTVPYWKISAPGGIFARFLCTKGHFGAAATAATAASDPNQSFQGRVWTLDSG